MLKSITDFGLDVLNLVLDSFQYLVHPEQERNDLSLQGPRRLDLHFYAALLARQLRDALRIDLLQVLEVLNKKAFAIRVPLNRKVALDREALQLVWVLDQREFFNALDVVAGHGEMGQLFEGLDALEGDQVVVAQEELLHRPHLGQALGREIAGVQLFDLTEVQGELAVARRRRSLLAFGRSECLRELQTTEKNWYKSE